MFMYCVLILYHCGRLFPFAGEIIESVHELQALSVNQVGMKFIFSLEFCVYASLLLEITSVDLTHDRVWTRRSRNRKRN